MNTLVEQNAQSIANCIENENWSIESAWKEDVVLSFNTESESIDCFHLREGSRLLPLEDEFYNLFPLIDKTKKAVRIYDEKNRYIEFNLISYAEYNNYIDYYLRYDDENGSHCFVCYATLRDLSEKVLNPYKMDKYLLKTLKRFWDREEAFLYEQYDKIKYQQMGISRKFIVRHKTPISYVVATIVGLAIVAVLFFTVIGVYALISN